MLFQKMLRQTLSFVYLGLYVCEPCVSGMTESKGLCVDIWVDPNKSPARKWGPLCPGSMASRDLQGTPEEDPEEQWPQPGLRADREGREAAPSQPLSHFLPSGLIFYDTKVTVMNRVLNATVQRTADHAAPEITLDPLEIVGGKTAAQT